MRTRLLAPLALAISAGFATQAFASGDDSCYPAWVLNVNGFAGGCNSLPFLSPGNDSQVNLRLLLADKGALPLPDMGITDQERQEGYGPVPFDMARLTPASPPAPAPDATAAPAPRALDQLTSQLGLPAAPQTLAGDNFLGGEGSRCRSNAEASASEFLKQLQDLPADERQALGKARLAMLGACDWSDSDLAALLPTVQSPQGQTFASYLQAAANFYRGHFDQAQAQFAALASSPAQWVKETALYMSARTALNAAQANAFDEYGMVALAKVDTAALQQAGAGFNHYLETYAQGEYATSARGLLRRVHWLAGDQQALAADFAWQLTQATPQQRNTDLNQLITEADAKLLVGAKPGQVRDPLVLAVVDLMQLRGKPLPTLTLAELQAQKPLFAEQPGLHDYLLGAYQLYIANDPDATLAAVPANMPAKLDYLAFSQQTLRGLALEQKKDYPGAAQLWLKLLPAAQQPLQRDQLEMALALNYQASGQLDKVFADDSPIKAAQLRNIMLYSNASADLLRRQVSKGLDQTERDTALFVLLYKDLTRGLYADFGKDMGLLPAQTSPEQKLTNSLGFVYGDGRSLAMFRWQGDQAASGYSCPAIADTAAALQKAANDPKALNCLGEFMLRNGLDSLPMDQRAAKAKGKPGSFNGPAYSRLDGYQQVIANKQAGHTDRAYALYRAINCYAPSGYNSCGSQDIAPALRKKWFRDLKAGYADTTWGKTLQYYW